MNGSFDIQNSTFENNTINNRYSILSFLNSSNINIKNNTFKGNQGIKGGSIYVDYGFNNS